MKRRSATDDSETRSGYLAIMAAVALCCLIASAQQTESPCLPYIWPGVAGVYFITALPLGMLVADFLRRRLSRPGVLLGGIAGLLVALLFSVGQVPPWQIPGGWLPRTALALLVGTSSLLVSHALLSPAGRPRSSDLQVSRLTMASGLLLATVVPSLYLDSRCEYQRQRLTDLLGQFRLGPALELAEQLNAISPRLDVNGLPVSRISVDLRAAVAEIELQLAEPLPPRATPAERLERARQAAILGHVVEAENVLAPLVQVGARNPQACNLLGLAYEGSEQWLDSRYWYTAAYQLLSGGEHARDDLLQAVMGIAYTQRKLGHYREAEIAYQRVLALDSSAAMHFLMAQFYEDAQQATKAQQYASLAMQMDPARYREAGRDLIDQLETNHFSCLPVFLRRRSAGLEP